MDKIAVRGNRHHCPVHGNGPIVRTQRFVKVNGAFIATTGNLCRCSGGTNDKITSGSTVLTVEGKSVSRRGDKTEHGGTIVEGESFFRLD